MALRPPMMQNIDHTQPANCNVSLMFFEIENLKMCYRRACLVLISKRSDISQHLRLRNPILSVSSSSEFCRWAEYCLHPDSSI
jgi:hypothetical protein